MKFFHTGRLWNGRQYEPAEGLPFSDRGVRYGMAVFETMRVRSGYPEFWDAHIQRLRKAADLCAFPVSCEALHAAADLFPLETRDGVARLYVSAGDGAPADAAENPRVAFLFEERRRQLPASYSVVTHPEPHLPPFGGLKTANYWVNAESLRRARATGAHEALLFTPSNALTGACMGNVFVKTKEGWVTPSLESGARDGVVRAWVKEQLGAAETRVSHALLAACDSLFITSSWLGIMPVHDLDGRTLNAQDQETLNLGFNWESYADEVRTAPFRGQPQARPRS